MVYDEHDAGFYIVGDIVRSSRWNVTLGGEEVQIKRKTMKHRYDRQCSCKDCCGLEQTSGYAAIRLERERELKWQLANAVCVIEMMIDESGGAPDGVSLRLWPFSRELGDRVSDVFKDYP